MSSPTRRDLLSQIACALAVAALPCRIPRKVYEFEPTGPVTVTLPDITDLLVTGRCWYIVSSEGAQPIKWSDVESATDWRT